MNKFAFLVPFYNHPQNIKALIAALKAYKLPVIVVDDGSDEASKLILAELERTEGILLLTGAQNGGKGSIVYEKNNNFMIFYFYS